MEGDYAEIRMGFNLARGISIHTLRMEGDYGRKRHFVTFFSIISIHTLRMEGDYSKSAQKNRTLLFKSNRPAEKLPTGRA